SCLEATAEPRVLASTDAVELDIDEFLATNSTLFIVGPSHVQQAIAPLIVGLVDAIAQRAAERAAAQGGRLIQPLLLALDEVANIAPLQSLPSLEIGRASCRGGAAGREGASRVEEGRGAGGVRAER